jgi:mRNA-degrading endonuclease toxin of MazEF toxin-antitoxin module
VADPKGNRKRRPAIVLTPTNEIAPDRELSVMAVSTACPVPAPPGYVELPWHNDPRRTPTRLNKRCAAVLHWLRFVRQDEIAELAGDVPPGTMLDILNRLKG